MFQSSQNSVQPGNIHFAIPPASRIDYHRRAMLAGLETAGTGYKGVKPPVYNLVFQVAQQVHGSFFIADTLRFAVEPKTVADEYMVIRFIHNSVPFMDIFLFNIKESSATPFSPTVA
jgi:hypothetical protein